MADITPDAFSENRERQYAVLHALRLAIEASIEIGTHICSADALGIPGSYAQTFDLHRDGTSVRPRGVPGGDRAPPGAAIAFRRTGCGREKARPGFLLFASGEAMFSYVMARLTKHGQRGCAAHEGPGEYYADGFDTDSDTDPDAEGK
jgi:hypothetical protein